MAITAFRIGSLASDVIGDIKTAFANPTAVNNYMSLEFPLTVDYVVTAGKTFYICKIVWSGDALGDALLLGYGDDGVADGAAAPTNPVPVCTVLKNAVANVMRELSVWIPIPAGKYPYVKSPVGNADIQVFGIEVTN